MNFAESKKEENIIEYLLLMFQIETLIRSNNFDVEQIFQSIILPQVKDERLAKDYKLWYQNIADELKIHGTKSEIHLSEVLEIQTELFYLHNSLLGIFNDAPYKKHYAEAAPIIEEFREKSQDTKLNDVDMAVQALYAKLLLRLRGQEISSASEAAFESIRKMLAHLAQAYRKMKAGDLNFINN